MWFLNLQRRFNNKYNKKEMMMTKKNDDMNLDEYKFMQLLGPTKNYPQHWVQLGAVGRKLYLEAAGYYSLDSAEIDRRLKDTSKKRKKI